MKTKSVYIFIQIIDPPSDHPIAVQSALNTKTKHGIYIHPTNKHKQSGLLLVVMMVGEWQ